MNRIQRIQFVSLLIFMMRITLPLFAQQSTIKCFFLPVVIDSSQTTDLIIRYDNGIDSINLYDLIKDFQIIDTSLYTDSGELQEKLENAHIICNIFKLVPRSSGEFHLSRGILYSSNQKFEFESGNSVVIRNQGMSNLINIPESVGLLDNIFDPSEKRIIDSLKNIFNDSLPALLQFSEKQYYNIEETIKVYIIANFEYDKNFIKPLQEIELNLVDMRMGYEFAKSDTSFRKYDYAVFTYKTMNPSVINFPVIKIKQGPYLITSNCLTIRIE